MSDQTQTQTGALGAVQSDNPTEPISETQTDTQGMLKDFAGSTRQLRQQGMDMLGRGMSVVRNEPWRAVLIGMFLGFLLGRRTRTGAHMVRVGYLEPTYHRAQGAMFMGTLALSSMWRLLRKSVAYRGREAMFAARLYSKPLTKATRRATRQARRKLHIGRASSFALWR